MAIAHLKLLLIHPDSFLGKLRRKLEKLIKLHILRDKKTIAIQHWRKHHRYTNILNAFPLDEKSVVFDLGGYYGNYSLTIASCYDSNIYLFEPSKKFYNHCIKRFASNTKIACFNYGLSNQNQMLELSDHDDGSSTLLDAENQSERVQIRKLSQVIPELGVRHIDLIKINIEGGEYHVLQDLIDSGFIEKTERILVQFHDFYPNSEEERDALRVQLGSTHRELWCEYFLWEAWEKKV